MKWADHPAAAWVLAAAAFAFAAASAKPFAGGWNDGSRLASVEALVERETFCIDGTVFLDPPAELFDRGTPPYDPANPALRLGTKDKLLIDGRFYTATSPAVSVPLAVAYRGLMAVGLPKASERPDVFAWAVTALFSGTGFALAVGCMWLVGTRVGLPPAWRLAWLGAFAFATVLPAYTRHANTHMALLGAAAAVCALLGRIADRAAEGRTAWGALALAGLLTSWAYNLDFGVGPALAPAVLAVVALRTRRALPVAACALAMLPGVAAGHAVNYAIGGDWLRPLGMHREYLMWPGSPFDTTMTGVIRPRPVAQTLYALDLLVGKKGFLTHNLPLLLALAAGVLVLRKGHRGMTSEPRPASEPRPEGSASTAALPSGRGSLGGSRGSSDRVELLALGGWCLIGWLMYGVLSKNHGGGCVSIRWFVPFLAPGFWLLAKVLTERPEFRRDFAALALWGSVLAAGGWMVGPWWLRNLPFYWWVFGGSLVTWGVVRATAPRAKPAAPAKVLPARRAA